MVDSAGSPNERVQSYRDRRSVPRYSLIAQAEVLEPVSGLRISGRISEVGRKGCYVDALNTLPVQTVIEVRIFRDQGSFHSPAKIVYTQDGIGMGIAFHDTPADQLKTLDSWIAELSAS
jgi:PilZ domain-containing protein